MNNIISIVVSLLTLTHVGILLVIVGTAFLAYAVKVENKYTLSARSKENKKRLEDIVKRSEDGSYYEPSIVRVDKIFFRLGLAFVALGSLMQW